MNQADPEERIDISKDFPDIVEDLKDKVMKHFENLLPGFAPDDVEVDNIQRILIIHAQIMILVPTCLQLIIIFSENITVKFIPEPLDA